ncbi:hypothetical protein LINPERPRIM_LOCUS34514 [Linum perenne]
MTTLSGVTLLIFWIVDLDIF